MNNVDLLVKVSPEFGVYEYAIQIKDGGIIYDDFRDGGMNYDDALELLKTHGADHVAEIDEADAPSYYGQFDYIVEGLSYKEAEDLAAQLMP